MNKQEQTELRCEAGTDMDYQANWQLPSKLSEIAWNSYDLVSFDIFDTVLHRALISPKSLFLELGRKAIALGLLDECMSPADFAQLRVDLEHEARRLSTGKSTEVTLSQIWEQAPATLPVTALMALELDVEYAHSFANPYSRTLIKQLQDSNIRFCLTSDTYFPRDFIERLLAKARIDISGIDLFLSCEEDANKSTGTLFQRLLAVTGKMPERILHIGDDLTADHLQAKKNGLMTCYLEHIHLPTVIGQHEMLLGMDGIQDPLHSIRRLGHFVHPLQNQPAAFFRYFGASVLGPGLCAFALWAVKDAIAKGVSLICPIMREGAILAPLLKKANFLLGANLEIKPFYVSRRAAFLPAMRELDEHALRQYCSRRQFSLAALIDELELPEVPQALQEHLPQMLNDIPCQEVLKEYLFSVPVQEAARRASKEARIRLKDYTSSLWHGHQKVAMMDLGPGGNSLAWLADSLDELADRIALNYLFYSVPELAKHRRHGHQYAVFMSHTPESLPLLRLFNRSPEPVEILLTGRHQTTLGYQRLKDGTVVPLLGRAFYDPQQELLLEEFSNGVDLAWRHFSHACQYVENDWFTGPEVRAVELRHIQRLLELPTSQEATCLGDLLFDDNAGSDSYGRICAESDEELLRLIGSEDFLRQARQQWGYQSRGVRWPQGVVTRHHPDILAAQRRALFNDVEHKLLCVTLLEQLKHAGHRRATLYGGGKLGHEMLQEAMARGIEIDFVVDSNVALHGLRVLDREIVPLARAARDGCGQYLVASAAFSVAIVEGIVRYYQEQNLPCPAIYAIKGGRP
ncbi:hypothetical protein [Aeromonas veronii]|uniref:hypothetical protein n=1 Tax=Aeromonas veronii TaxID=654 RepID=UPI001116CA9F|nr:hypothetical protein [Aeromonas veronii]